MFAVHARYRGRSSRRADLVRRSAAALSTLQGVGEVEVLGVEDICAPVSSAEAVCDLVMALLSDGEWAISIGVFPGSESAEAAMSVATAALRRHARAGTVRAAVEHAPASAHQDIEAVFALLGQVLHKRTLEGREATSLVRRGLNQNEAARELGISKQAVSQRLHAAGWHAETAGWQLAVNILRRADSVSA
ncbi:MarR family transcriptional regulator [Corynebacterium uropygiale]|uniref:MarR family transcriptional regulator n=1 Tax=Corynebacterium uropygiale TaxID=1775911 RepID=A0A9X1QNG8_9CORY|nr:MarR family transcriptional regulator [Corynebacterium uropygiale]MCF4006627.1 MarR family transcriptional regulator [Corynebacterium uropygiale]